MGRLNSFTKALSLKLLEFLTACERSNVSKPVLEETFFSFFPNACFSLLSESKDLEFDKNETNKSLRINLRPSESDPPSSESAAIGIPKKLVAVHAGLLSGRDENSN